jgi:hypothetical protein
MRICTIQCCRIPYLLRLSRSPELTRDRFWSKRCHWHPCDQIRDPDTTFSTSGFFHQTTPPRPLIHRSKPFWIWLQINYEIVNFRKSNVNDTAVTKNDPLLTTIFFLGESYRYSVGNLSMYVFSIGIPFKGSQNLANMRSKVSSFIFAQRCH